MVKVKKDDYERIELTFAKDNDVEMEIYEYIKSKSKLLGKGKYIKNLIYEVMEKANK